MWNDDDRKWLYEQMRKNGVNTGSYDDFTKSLDNKEDRDWYYQKSRSLGLNVGSADDFASMMVQPVQKPAPAQPVVKQTTGQVNPTVNTSTQPKQDEQPQKQGGWQPTWQEKMGMQMQLDETMRQVKQSQQDFNTRMENIRKGNTLGKTSEVKFNPESGKMERRYYTTHGDEVTTPLEQSRLNLKYRDEWEATTPEGQAHHRKRMEEARRRQVEDLSSDIDVALTDAKGRSVKQYTDYATENPFMAAMLSTAGAASPGDMQRQMYEQVHRSEHIPTKGAEQLHNEIVELEAAQRSMRDAKRIIGEADHNAQKGTFGKWLESSFAGGAARGLGQKLFDVDTWDFGGSDLSDAGALMTALNAYDRGEELTRSQQMLLDAKAVELATDAYFGSEVGRGYKAGKVTAESIPFMLEMCINPAAGTGHTASSMMTRYALKRFGKQAVKNNVKKYVAAKVGARVAGDVTGAATMAATTGVIRTAADATERMNGQVMYGTDAQGKSVFAGHTEGDDAATAIGKAFANTTIENYSEMVGEYFAPVLGTVGKVVRKGMGKIGLESVGKFVDDVAASDVAKMVSDFEKHSKWNGMIGEYAEEVAGGIMNALVVGDQTLDTDPETGVFNLDNNIDTFLGVSLMGGFMSSVKAAGYRTPKYRARQQIKQADEAALHEFGGNQDAWGAIRNTLAFGNDEDVKSMLAEVSTSAEYSDEQKMSVLEYSEAVERYKGMLRGEEKNVSESRESTEDPAIQEEMADIAEQYGREADTQERKDIAIELADPNNAEAQEAWNGVVQRINEDAAYMVAQQREQTKQMQHTDGSLRPAILKEKDSEGNDQQVYIVDGNVQMMPDGSVVDKASSDNIVVIYNPATGERKQIDPSADTGISSLGEVTTAEQREADIERSRQEYVQAQIDEAQGTVRFVPGQQLVLPTGEEAVVVDTDADGENITVALGDGTQATVQRSELQRIRDEKAAADYRQRHGITEEPAAQQHEASMPAQPQADGRVAGAPADYTADMELTIRDEDGSEKPAMVMGRVRYENGSFVPDANGNIIEYFMDGEVKHDHEDKLIDKVVSHVAPVQPEQSNNTSENIPVQGNNAGENIPQTPIETPAHAEPTNVKQPTEVAPQKVQEPVQTVEPQPAQPAETPVQQTEQPTAEPMPLGEDGEEDWQATTPERAHAYIFNKAGLSRSEGNEFIAAQTQAAQSALAKAKSAQMPRVGTSIKKYNEAKAKRQEKIDEAQRVLDYWQQVRNIQNDIQRVENERRAAEDAVRHDEALAEAQAEYEARKQAEEERKAVGNENPMPAITEKWNNATKVDGHRDEIMLPDGTPLKGHYVLHESGASSPSHNPETWQKTDGFPMDSNDNSVNDRDYERDHDAQEHTQSIARQYDQRALQSVPVVSNDGVVLSGNGRTMAGELAARDNTDGAYVNYLKEYAPKFGFTTEQVEAMQHPRVSFVPDEAMPYTAETFAKFNQQEMKSQNKTEQAVKLGKTVSDDSFKGIVRTINGYDTLGDFYNDAEASLGAVYDLHNSGVVPQAQLAEMVDGIRGQEKLSAVGREFLENMLIGKAFESDPEAVRMLTAEPAMRQTVITALGEIVDNIALGGDWSLQGELADAVKLCFDARQGGAKYGEIVSTYARQGVLFADPDELQTVADFNNATMLMLADVLNDKSVTLLKTTLQLYNNNARQSASGQTDLFAGGIQSREDILRDVITFINENYGKRKEIEAARAEAVERRKAESVQQDGTPPAVSTDGEATAEPSAEPAPVEAEPVEATEPVEAEPNAVQTALAAAEKETNTEPTEAQKEAGNYKKGHVKIDGYDVTIENPKGSVRRGTDASGKQWEQEMQNTYGYIRGTEGVDGDHIDVFFSEDPSQGDVFVVDQVNKDGSFDEHKVMYGFPDIESARKAYLSNYEDGWQGLGAITPVSKEEFKKWIDSSHRKTKPFAEYSSVKPLGDTQLGEQPTAGYSIEPTTYTNKKGKTTPMHLVTFGRELSKDEIRAGKEIAKESRGWWDREKGGFMMRDEDSAKSLAEALSNEEAVQDAQPLSVEDVATVTDQADMKSVDDAIKVEQEPQTTPQYDYDRENDVYDKTLTGLRNVLNDRKRGAIPNIKSIENVIRDLRKRAKTIEDGMATAAGETIPQAFEELANLTGKRRAYEQFLSDIRKKMAETERDDALAAHGVKLGDKIMYKGKEATIHDADAKQVILDTGLAPVLYEVTDWENVELPKPVKEANADEVQDAMPMEQETTQSEQKEDVSEQNTASSEQEQPKQEEKKAKSKWVDDADAERFEELRRRLLQKLGGQLNMGVDPEAFALGVEMSYLMLKHGARKFAEFAKQMIEALGENVRPYLKSFYNGARDLPEMAEYEKELTPYDEVRTFDVMNFDKEGAKDIVATAEHIVREQAAEREAKEATDKLKQERNEQRKETEQEVAANTEALASEAATVASEVESKLPSARSEQEVNDLAKSIDDAIDKVNDQLALLGYYDAEPVESDFNEAYGYMRNAEKKAVKNVTELFKTLTKELGISDPVVYDTKGKKQKSVTANIAPAGGDVTMRFMLNRDKGVELYIDFMLEPDYENNRDNLVLKGIMFRPEKNLPNGVRDYLRANNFFPVDVTVPQMLQGIRSVCQEWLPAEDYVAMAQRIAAENSDSQHGKPTKERKSKKKSVSLQEQTIPDLFSGLFSEDLKPTSNEQEVHVQPRTSITERERGHQREQNEPLGESKQNEDERPDTGGVVRRSGNDTKSDTTGGSRVSEPSDGKRNVKPAKPEPAPLAESDRKNTHNNHAERGTDYAPKGTSARIEANIKAIETMQRLVESGEQATPEDMSVLRKFSGWGGLGAAFKEKVSSGDRGYNPRLRDDYQPDNPINARLHELLSPEAYEAANLSRNTAYYTPAPIIDAMWDVARAMGFRGGSVLEGSAGIGKVLGLMPTDMSERSNIQAIEVDETTGNILKLLYPDAKVDVKGFEKTYIPNGSVDLAITNVPFGDILVKDETGDKDLSKKFRAIHDFCIAKNIRKLKEGGIGIFISTSGTLDSANSAKLRNWIVNEGNADVVGAFRMHKDTFGGAGVTSDIIVIRKRVNGRKSANAIDVSCTLPIRTVKYNTGETKRGSSEVVIKDLALDVNKHFVEHPEDMAGEMAFAFEKGDTYRATSKALYPSPSINQEQRLSEWTQQFKDMDWDKAEERESQQVVYEDLGEDVKEGSMLLDSDGNLCLAQRGKAVPINVNANKVKGHTKAECFNAYKAIKDALADVLEYQTTHSDDSGLQQRLAKLNKAYDSFVKTYGHLNKNTSITFLRSDMDYPSIAALESVSETGDKSGKRIVTYGKTDIFSRRVVETESEPKPTTIKDGIIASIYLNGRVDIPYIAEQLNMSDSDVRRQIIESGLGFENPTTTEMEVSYEYLSGNVREKLRQAQENNTDGRYDANIKALERVIPMNIPAHLIEFTLGSSWVEPKLYEDFVKERTGLDVKLTNAGGTWIMSEPYYTNTEQNKAMGVISEKCDKTILGHELIKAAITCKSISVTKTISTGYGSSKTTETIVDKEATMACANKIDEIRQDFKDWARGKMHGNPEMSERMERVYNELFNNSVPKVIPDDFVPEHFGGAATVVNGKPFKLRPHQAKAVIRATTQPLMLAHEVGTGKTYTLISTAMEMRRLGTARKPMIVVQNATVGQFVASAKALYPNAKILTLEDADRNAEGRRNFYAKIRYNDWDMIVVPQSVFERIPDSEERQIRFVEDKVEEKMMVLEKMREAANDDRDPVLRQAQRELDQLNDELNDLKLALQERKAGGKTEKDEKREAKTRQNAMVKAQEMLDRETDDVANFDDMGIDALLIDEAHEYKHLGFATAMQRGVKGVDPSYSKKSQGVYLKTQAVLESKNGKNVVFATGTPISNTAAEIWTFMRYLMPADTMREYGIYYFDDFVRNFGNIQQMLEFSTNGKYKENNRFAGYVNLPELVRIWAGVADTVLTREAGGVSDKIPKMDGEKAQDIYLPQTKALRGVMKFVKDQLDDYEKMSGKEKKENSHIPLVMYGIAKAAAVDARLVLEDAADEPNSKTNEAVRQTLRSLEDTKEYNGTVAIFADNYQNKATGFNLYEDIRKKLIDAGVPETQVVVMKSGMSIKKKLEIFDKVNRGEVRVIMGSTFTLGTGVNIQERLHTLIHVDAPNRPMDYTQRNGRILRQGNLHNEWGIPVRVLRFGVEDSLDVTAYQRLKTKGAIADSIMEGKKMMSNSMENRVLEEEQDLFGDITAQLSGSQYALLKNQVEKEVRKLEARKKQWEADQTYVHNQKPRLKALIKDSEERAKRNKEALARVEAAKNDGITIGKMKFQSLDSMGDYIKDYNSKQREQQEQVRTASGYQAEAKSDITVSVGGFDFHIHRVISKEQKQEKGQLSLSFFSKTQMTYSCPELGLEDVPVDGQRLKSALEDILENVLSGDDFREKAEYADRAAERYKGELQQVEARDGKPFEYADELKQAKEKLAEYEELMKAEMAEKEAKYAEMDASVEAAKGVQLSDEEDGEITKDGDMYRDGEYDDDIEQDSTMQEDRDMMRSAVLQMGEKLHTNINIIEDVNEITHPNAAVQERRRKSKGWYDTVTGQVNIVLDNNKNIDDVKASVGHETIAHKGLRELVGEENYDEFLDETYLHLRDDLKKGVDDSAGRAFVDDATKNGKRAKSYEQHRRTAVDELFGRMAEKPFEEFSEGERTLWHKIKATVRRLLDKFLGSLKLPKWFELGDNELRYILWRSKERLERGKEHPIDLARDIVKREELGLTDEARYNMGDAPETFKARQKRAVENKGTVMPGLNDAQVKVVDVPRHHYTGNIAEATRQAIEVAKAKFAPNGKARTLRYDNFGATFDYSISGSAVEESLNPKQQAKSVNKGVHIAMAEHLDEIIGQSIEVEEHPDYLKNEKGERNTSIINDKALMHRFYGAVVVDGVPYRVMTLMREDRRFNEGNAVHAYEVQKIEVLDEETPNTPNGSHTSKVNALVPVAVAKVIKNVEKSYDTGKNLLEQSKLADESTDLYRDPEETEDIWNDQSLGLQERITAAATRLANNHRDNNTLRHDAMRAIGGNLSDLRKAMSLQRTFDMTTVKRVADLARVLMNNGYLNGLTQQEVKRLLAAVKNSVGHNDIEGDVQKVMDIMVDNQLKHAEDTLHELEAIRGSKVDARGVEVQGQLDPAGAHTMKVFKKTRGWEKTDIEEAISEAQQRMGSSDVAVADEAALEYTGLQLALEYAENIKDSKVEERKLREEIKQAHDDATERDRATDSYRQYIASLQEAIRQNKIERAQSYFDLVGRLSDSLRESIANAKDFKEAEKQRIREIQHNANSDMEGRPSDEHYKPTFADKLVNNSFVSFMFAPLATFDQMLRMFGGKSANGEGYLYNRFMRGWVDARQKEINGVRDKYAILDAKAAELFGGKVKTWGDLIRRVGKLPKGTVSFWNGGEMQERKMTQGNLMYIYMVNKMLDGRMKLRKMGITEENVADIEEVLDPRLIELADWLQDEFLVQTRNEYNDTHKRMFGASMAAIEHYFPLKILANARADKPEDLDNPDKSDGISTATGSIIKRRRNALALDITGADALSVILDHVAQMEHWNAFAEFNRDINTLRTYKRFRNQVQNMTTIYGSGKELWKKFNDVCQMASGTYRPPRTKLDEAAVNFAKGVTAAKVSFRMFTALKQFLSMPAYIPEARTDYLLRNIANPVGAWKWSMEHLPIFNERWRSRMSGDPRLLKSDMDWKMWRTRIMQLASRAGMSPNAFVDALTVSIGAHSMYQTRHAQYLRDGYSEADAEKKAVQDAEVLYNQTQQSSEGAFTSTMQVDRSWLSVLFTVFRNASMSYQRQLHDALRNFKHNLTPGGRARSIEFMTKQLLRDKGIEPQTDGNWSDADWQREEQVAKRKFRRQLLKDTLRVATFGYIMQFAWNLGAYLPYLLFGDDEDEKQKMWDDVWAHTAFGSVEGLTGGDLMSQAGQMMLTGEGNPAYLSKDMPLTSDIMAAFQKLGNGQHTEALNDMINLIVQAGLGVNPQSITDVALSIMDACGDDPALAHEATICITRILQVPQSQIDKMYFDEVGMSGDEVSKYTPAQLAERYAKFKVKRGRFLSPWSWNDEERIGKFADKANKTIKERTEQMGDDKVNEAYLQYEEVYKGVDAKVKEAKKTAKTDYVEAAQLMAEAQSDTNAFATYQMFKQMDGNFNKIVKFYLGAKTPDEAALCRQAVLDYKAGMVKVLQSPDAATRAEAMNSLGNVMQDFSQKYVPMQQLNR